ncbi:hypothetical protein ACC807_30545 [Rhizobium ruizarguesonis]|jgi:hypothetical protein|uniref:hypothetical protein n=1 Tax=Rhizobium ruizarguesonis TaxID=2081791 RepID=UPI0010304781|nr:hypothetical protein [Rhizobium ruizarguesonis]NEH38758.1 hypothetical protein [Rhizobium ruizarguesonis]NEI29560.1 hypothetical protein [Rhizobium ruizarguesonis]TBB91431.1 hypothetical protein ELH38_04780 [Rhizobium ruizarguesonis]TBY82105.1 hypothetical protein E0H40_34185 [Rhizobium leguminosarum bv. viciae]
MKGVIENLDWLDRYMVSINDNPEIRETVAGVSQKEVELTYSVAGSEGVAATDLLIGNCLMDVVAIVARISNWLSNIDAPVRGALITATATCLSALVGFTAVFLQIGRQGRNAIAANTKNEQLKRKVEIYERTLETSRTAQKATLELTSFLRRYGMNLATVEIFQDIGTQWQAPAARYPEYMELRNEATTAIIGVVNLIESWHIIEPKLHIFCDAIGLGLDEHSKVVTPPDLLVYKMPVAGHEREWELPSPEEVAAIERRVQREIDEIQRLSAWIGDFQIEMQILLLGDLFPSRVVRRDPPDPDQFCIRLDRYEEVKGKIDSSEWMQQVELSTAEAWARFADKNKKDTRARR